MPTRAQTAERDTARAQLREYLKPGDTVYTIISHASRTGLRKSIRVLLRNTDGSPFTWDGLIARATGLRFDRVHGGVITDEYPGEFVANLSTALYGSPSALSHSAL